MPPPYTPPPSFLHTIRSNARDIFFFLVLGIGLTAVSGLIDYVAELFGENRFVHLVLPSVSLYLQGFAKFVGASLSATMVFMFLWPTISHFGNFSFGEGWQSLSTREKFLVYLGMVSVALLAASNCFK